MTDFGKRNSEDPRTQENMYYLKPSSELDEPNIN